MLNLANACVAGYFSKPFQAPYGKRFKLTEGPLETGGRAVDVLSGFLMVREHPGNVSQYSLKFYAKFDNNLKDYPMNFFENNVGLYLALNPNGTLSGFQYRWDEDYQISMNFNILLDSNIGLHVEKFNWIQMNGIEVTDVNERKKREEPQDKYLHRWVLFGISFDMQPFQQTYKFYVDGKFAGSFSETRDLAATNPVEKNTLTLLGFHDASFSCAEFTYDVESDDFFAKRDFEECSE